EEPPADVVEEARRECLLGIAGAEARGERLRRHRDRDGVAPELLEPAARDARAERLPDLHAEREVADGGEAEQHDGARDRRDAPALAEEGAVREAQQRPGERLV